MEDILRSFGMANLLTESALDQIERDYSINFRRPILDDSSAKDKLYLQFEQKIRNEAEEMAKHYAVFYCLEKSIKELISNRLFEEKGSDWWEICAPEHIKTEAKKRQKNELGSGVTPRSHNLIDFTTFGELGQIIISNWDIFSDTFYDKSAVQSVMSLINTIRAPIAHCTLLAEDEVVRLDMSLRDWFRLMG